MNPTHFQRIAKETRQSWHAKGGYVCSARLSVLLTALNGAARLAKSQRNSYAVGAMLGLLAIITGAALMALILLP